MKLFRFRGAIPVLCMLAFGPLALADGETEAAVAARNTAETRAMKALEAVRGSPPELRNFLLRMPKGADLHVHLGGAVYAESFIRAGAEDNLCVDLAALAFAKSVAMTMSQPPQPVCGQGSVPAANALTDQHLYDALVNSFSMRSFVPSAGVSGHDHFFDAFAKMNGIDRRHNGEWLDEVASRAAAQNEQYLELMHTPKTVHGLALAEKMGWQDDFENFRTKLLEADLRDDVRAASDEINRMEALRQQREHCGSPQPTAACKVEIRYLFQILRGLPKQFVFAQTLVAFEVASADPRFVGINYVMPEDGYTSMNDYALHMRMVAFFRKHYPKVHVTLHAGELAPGLVPPDGLCCHIRLALEVAGAERIGHGVDVMYEDQPAGLLREMAAKHVMVEVNFSSNDLILGVSGKDHPFPIYRKHGVPVALSTDDEGVSRIDLTHEFVRAVQTYNLTYADLKKLVRTGLEHSFLPGESLWQGSDVFSAIRSDCAEDTVGLAEPSARCGEFLNSSEKARQQWQLERRFKEFEATFEPPRQSVKKPN